MSTKLPRGIKRTRWQENQRYKLALDSELTRARSRIRTIDVVSALLALAVGVLGYTLAVICVDYAWMRLFDSQGLPNLVRQGLLGLFTLGFGAYLFFAVIRPLSRRVNLYYAARALEKSLPETKNGLVNWLDLRNEPLAPIIQTAVQDQAVVELKRADMDEAIPIRRPLWLFAATAVLALLLGFFAILWRDQIGSLLQRAYYPFESTAIPTDTRLQLTVRVSDGTGWRELFKDEIVADPANAPVKEFTIEPGQQVLVEVVVEGKVPEQINLEYQAVLADQPVAMPLAPPRDEQRRLPWSLLMTDNKIPADGFWFRVRGGDGQTRLYHLLVASTRPPVVETVRAEYRYPAYTRRPPKTEDLTPLTPLRAIAGTRATLWATTDRPVKAGSLEVFVDGTPVGAPLPLQQVEGDEQRLVTAVPLELTRDLKGRTNFWLRGQAFFQIRLTSEEGKESISSLYPIEVEDDLAPRVQVAKVGQEEIRTDQTTIRLPVNAIVPISGKAQDDIALRVAELRLRDGEGRELRLLGGTTEDRILQEPSPFGYPPEVEYQLVLDLSKVTDQLQGNDPKPLELKAGQTLEFWVEALDNCEPERNVGASRHFTLELTAPLKPEQRQEQEKQAGQAQKEHQTKAGRKPDGTKTETQPDGTTTETKPDGTKIETKPDGTKTETTPDETKTETKPDGTKTETKKDGTKTETQPDGTKTETKPDGTKTETKKDGTKTETKPDGTKTETKPDGTKTETKPDGTKTETKKDGTKTETKADGTKTETKPDGTQTETRPDGSKTETKPDGTKTETKPDGTQTETKPDGTKTETKPDKTKTETKPDGTQTETKPDGTQTVTKPDKTKTETKPDGTKTETKPDGTQTETKPDGTQTVTKPDGTKTEKKPTTETKPDGTKTETKPDGTKTETKPDGTKTETCPDGTKTATKPDGTKTETCPDGTKTETKPDGTKTETKPDGTQTVTKPDKTKTETKPDGTKTETRPDGTKTETKPDGTKTETKPDGTKTQTKPDGTKIETKPDGTKIETKPDGTKIETKPDGTKIETKPDGTKTETRPSGTEIETKPDGTKTKTRPDGSKTETKPDGTKTESKPDGTKTETKPDGTETETKRDGTKIETKPDGTRTETKPDGTKTESKPETQKEREASLLQKRIEEAAKDLREKQASDALNETKWDEEKIREFLREYEEARKKGELSLQGPKDAKAPVVNPESPEPRRELQQLLEKVDGTSEQMGNFLKNPRDRLGDSFRPVNPDPADPEHQKQATGMVLRTLEDAFKEGKVNKDVLKHVDLTEQQGHDFKDQLREAKENALLPSQRGSGSTDTTVRGPAQTNTTVRNQADANANPAELAPPDLRDAYIKFKKELGQPKK